MNKLKYFVKTAMAVGLISTGAPAEAMEPKATADIVNDIDIVDITISNPFESCTDNCVARPETTVDPATVSAFELRRQAVQRAPISAYVLDDTVRNFQPTEEDMYLTLKDGQYEAFILVGTQLREPEQKHFDGFRAWVKENELPMPPGW